MSDMSLATFCYFVSYVSNVILQVVPLSTGAQGASPSGFTYPSIYDPKQSAVDHDTLSDITIILVEHDKGLHAVLPAQQINHQTTSQP
ncbi:hypothetical protein EMCG_01972 [[Emmonsia] crescens]|uniref:Uncharacterized protein n=1 Tax=[Emmonsia] crescens TaxID=73230 RepID=A0A0G2I027_9EURO|nr:hypothetical protein EMCG_01972 [Emmonsia crescens UAMH 3008]